MSSHKLVQQENSFSFLVVALIWIEVEDVRCCCIDIAGLLFCQFLNERDVPGTNTECLRSHFCAIVILVHDGAAHALVGNGFDDVVIWCGIRTLHLHHELGGFAEIGGNACQNDDTRHDLGRMVIIFEIRLFRILEQVSHHCSDGVQVFEEEILGIDRQLTNLVRVRFVPDEFSHGRQAA